MQTPIDHLSRHNFFVDPYASAVFFWPMYGPLIAIIPFIFRKWPPRFLGLTFSFVFLFVLGLGGTTSLPRFLFGENWEWLTYDRFAFWASLTLLPFFGTLFVILKRKWRHRFIRKPMIQRFQRTFLSALVFSAFAGTALGVWFVPIFLPTQPAPIDMQPIVDFLNYGDRSQWRYLTFGFGNQFTYLNLLTKATTIDGSYHTARTLPELRESGIGEIDTAYWSTKGIPAIDPILRASAKYGVRWGFVNRPEYVPELERNGWIYQSTLSNGISIWENPQAVLPLPSKPPSFSPLAEISWGILPLLSFAVTLILAGLRLRPDATKKILSTIHSMAIGLLPLGLCFWYFRTINAVDYPGIYFSYDNALFFLSDGLALIAILAWLLMGSHGSLFQRERGWHDESKWFFVFCALASLSVIWSLNWQISLYVSLHWWLVFALYISLRESPQAWKPFAIGCCAALVFEFIIGLGEFAAQTSSFLNPLGLVWPGELDPSIRGASVIQLVNGFRFLRSYGTLPHPNILGGFIIAFLAGPLALFAQNKRTLWIPGIIFSVSTILLVLTFSRSAWVGFFASIAILLYKLTHLDHKRLIMVGVLLFLSLAPIFYSVRGLVFPRLGMAATVTETNSITTRLDLINLTFKMISDLSDSRSRYWQ